MQFVVLSLFAAGIRLSAAQVQAPAPAPVLLTTLESGVLPVLPTATAFAGVETIEGAITYDGPLNPGFTGLDGDAVTQTNTPGASFEAVLPNANFDPYTGSTITGSITATVPSSGQGVVISVNFAGFPSVTSFGPFVYHIHTLPISSDGNCTTSLGHLDPTNRGEYYPCDPTQPQTCQAGDLSGKHGNITGASLTASYAELYLSTDPSSPYYFGDKSIVIHAANTTRLTCANFAAAQAGSSSAAPATTPVATGVTVPVASPSVLPSTVVPEPATPTPPGATVPAYTGAASRTLYSCNLWTSMMGLLLLL